MAENRGPTIYYIPDNFIGEEKIFGGRINVRYLIDSVLLGVLLVALIWLPLRFTVLKDSPFNIKITVLMVTASPGILAGQLGFNGDPISIFLINFFRWIKNRQIRIYNSSPRLLGTDPVKAIYQNNMMKNKLVGMVQDYQQRKIDAKNAEEYVEGETFEFQYDPGIDGYLDDNGDFSEEAMGSSELWPQADVNISAGSDLEGLLSLLRAFEAESMDSIGESVDGKSGDSDASEDVTGGEDDE